MASVSLSLLNGKDLLGWCENQPFLKPGKITCVIPYLYQGNKSGAGSLSALEQRNVVALLSIGGGPCRLVGFDFEHIGVHDGNSILNELEKATNFIHQNIQNQQSCFVYCMGGFSRSPTVIIAYLIKYRSLSLQEALTVVRHARPKASPNGELKSDLLAWEKIHTGKNSLSLNDF
jgi:hypothetical protein